MVYCFPLWSNPLLRASNIYSGALFFLYICVMLYHASGYQSIASLWPLVTGIPFLFLPFWEQKIVLENSHVFFCNTFFKFGKKQVVEGVSVKQGNKSEHIILTVNGKTVDTHFYGKLDDPSSLVSEVVNLYSHEN